MDLTLSPEQTEIVDSSAAFLRARLPISRTRELLDTDRLVDDAAWASSAELGWFGLGLPEERGGVGFGLAAESLLFREIGRSLAAGPFLATVLAARVAAFAGRDDLAATILAGDERVGLVIGGSLEGPLQLLDADGSLVVVVSATATSLVEVAALDDVVQVPCVDPACTLRRAVGRDVEPVASVTSDVDPIERRGLVLAAAMSTGITEAVRDLAAAHATSRIQFGKPIGVNQAVKHPCAQMAVRAELAHAQTVFAAVASDEGRRDADFHALSALLVATEAAGWSAAATIQVLGGMGFTFEHDAQLYLKRALVLSHLFGGTGVQLERLLTLDPAD
ncbi:MAG: acyl-CoA dehydrogenase family protein [Acidimicrobiia bacterium]